MFKRRSALAFVILWLASTSGYVSSANAILVESQISLVTTADQSFWGPGRTASSFGSHDFFGGEALGISYNVSASTGSVSGQFGGMISSRYSDAIFLGDLWRASFIFDGGGVGAGTLSTTIGAKVNVTAHALGIDGTIVNENKAIDINHTYAPLLGHNESDSGSVTAISPGAGINIGVGSAKAGVDLKIEQKISFTGKAITGNLVAINEGSGHVLSTPVSLDANGIRDIETLSLLGNELGIWHLKLTDLTLSNDFATEFLLGLDPFVQYTIGVGCGNPGTNHDNGWFCIADDKSSFHAANIDLLQTKTFALSFDNVSIPLLDVRVVPEPNSLLLFLVGLGLILLVRKRRLSSILSARKG